MEQNLLVSPALDAHVALIKTNSDIARWKQQEIISVEGQDAKAWPLAYAAVLPMGVKLKLERKKINNYFSEAFSWF